nr:aspartate and glycine-rich protein-like [Penaeus vannamei]
MVTPTVMGMVMDTPMATATDTPTVMEMGMDILMATDTPTGMCNGNGNGNRYSNGNGKRNGNGNGNGFTNGNGYKNGNGNGYSNGNRYANGNGNGNGYTNGNGFLWKRRSWTSRHSPAPGERYGAEAVDVSAVRRWLRRFRSGDGDWLNGVNGNGYTNGVNGNGVYRNGNGNGAYTNGNSVNGNGNGAFSNGNGAYGNGNGAYSNGNGGNGVYTNGNGNGGYGNGNGVTVYANGVVDPFRALADAIGGGGVPGVDYPILAFVPATGFSCNGQLPGYYADTAPEAGCQVFHICQAGGRIDSFLCPNGTVFNQQYFVCDWWYNFDCSTAEQFYGLNAELGNINGNGYTMATVTSTVMEMVTVMAMVRK